MSRQKQSLKIKVLVPLLAALLPGCYGAFAPPARPQAAAVQSFEVRHQGDAQRGRVWLLTYEGLFVYEPARTGRTAVELPGWVSAGEPFGCLPDLALGPHGEAVVTSNVVSTLWKVEPRTLAVSVHPLALDAETDKDIGFTGLAYSAQHGGFLAASYSPGTLWRIDRALTRADKLSSIPVGAAPCGEGPWAVDSALLQLGDAR